MQPHTIHIAIMYHHFWRSAKNCDIEIQPTDTKEQIMDIFTKPLDYELFGYLHSNNNGWYIKGILLCKGFWYYKHKVGILEDPPKKCLGKNPIWETMTIF